MHVNDINDALNDYADHKINILFYADDLVIIANTRLDLQTKLDILHQYCIKKCLSVNIKKSNILVINFRKPTSSFKFSTDTLEEVDSFKYLGLTFCRNGLFLQAQENLACQARRAQASLDCYIMQHKHLPVNVIFELFDTLIKPILLYGSEMYGSSMSKDIEQVHVNFIKKTLSVKPSTNNCDIYVETGRYALQIDVHIRMIKYWLKLTLSHSHQYINKLFCKPSEWLSYVQQIRLWLLLVLSLVTACSSSGYCLF